MSKPELSKALPRISPRWTEERGERVRAAVDRRTRRHRAFGRAGVFTGAAGIAFVAALLIAPRFSAHKDVVSGVTAKDSPQVTAPLASGPSVVASSVPASTALLDPDSEVVPEPEAGVRAVRLQKGAARFTVSHDETHPFRVRVGSAVIEDVGTIFTVRRLSDSSAEVAVDEGQVRVAAADGSFEVRAGEQRTFNTDSPAADALSERDHHEARAAAVPAWRPLAESGRYGEAYASMKNTGRAAVRDEAGELLLAADVARLSGHPADAVPYLERLLQSRAGDPRAGLAAFTLGRVELDDLGRPAEAAAAFERARKAGGPLAEDALAREVEAFSRAGDTGRARSLAEEYEKRYPHGRRARSVAKFGGLE